MNVPITDPRRVQFEPGDNGNHKNRRATCAEKHNQWQIQSAHYKQSLQLIKISGLSGPVCHANVQCDTASHQWEAGRPEEDSQKTFASVWMCRVLGYGENLQLRNTFSFPYKIRRLPTHGGCVGTLLPSLAK